MTSLDSWEKPQHNVILTKIFYAIKITVNAILMSNRVVTMKTNNIVEIYFIKNNDDVYDVMWYIWRG